MAYPVQADPTAVFGRRVVAVLIDALLILVPVLLLVSAEFEYLEVDSLGVAGQEFCDRYLDDEGGFCLDFSDVDDRVYYSDGASGSASLVYWGGTILMLVVLQAFTGWTLGKLIMGIRCVREDGRPAGFVKALVRWLLWIVDGFFYVVPIVGPILALTTVGHRRLGDMAAKTFVVRASAAGSPIVVPGLTAPPVAPGGIWGGPPPPGAGVPAAWATPTDPNAAGWASPTPPPAAAPAPAPAAPAPGPQWDEARGTYIQWDPAEGAWMEWSEGLKTWSRIAGQ